MIELFEQNERMQDRQSSKGNQLKWENAGIWYKADYTGYEGENVEDVIQRHFELLNDIEKKFQDDDTILMVGHGCSLYAFIKILLKNQKLDFPQNASAIIVNKVNNEYQLETVLNPK